MGLRDAISNANVQEIDYAVEERCKTAYRNCLYWYDGDEPDGSDHAMARFAYSEREHWEFVMDELGIDYDDVEPTGSGEDNY